MKLNLNLCLYLFEFNRWLDCLDNSNTTHFITYQPIQLDATCNGYQHISMLVQDLNLAKHLNLVESDRKDVPDDFYSFVATYLRGYFNLFPLGAVNSIENVLFEDKYKNSTDKEKELLRARMADNYSGDKENKLLLIDKLSDKEKELLAKVKDKYDNLSDKQKKFIS